MLTVTAVYGSGRAPSATETWHVDPAARIFSLDTSEGRYGWAVVAEDALALADRLGAVP